MKLKDKLEELGIQDIGSSFDIIGDVIIIQFPDKFKGQKKVASVLMDIHKHVKTVCKKIGKIEGEERIPKIVKVLGNGTETIHKENGFSFKLDVKKVFFTPRMQNERLRVINQIKKDEKVLDMFAGIGPYAIPAAKKSNVYAIDINPPAIKYLKENAKLNKVQLSSFVGDCKKIIKKQDLKSFDRVIMNFPKGAINFLDIAINSVKKGGIIHLYCFEKEDRIKIDKRLKLISRNLCGDIAPGVFRVAYDLMKK